jgi:hypothetical protein
MKIGDCVIWTNAGDGSGWALAGKARIAGYDQNRPYFRGTSPGSEKGPPTGPAVLIVLDDVKPGLAEVWVTPDELMPDLAHVASEAAFLREPSGEAHEAP